MNACKYSENHACDESCKVECRLWRTMKPSGEWDAKEKPTHATEENPYYYEHPEGQPLCACDWPQVWLSWPHECRNCGRIIPSPSNVDVEPPSKRKANDK